MKLSDPMSRLLLFLIVIGGAIEAGLVVVKRTGSESTIALYVDVASVVLVGIVATLLVLIIPRANRRSFRGITALLTAGFLFQLTYMFIWYYYWHVADPPYLPIVNVGDFFYLGSYAFWIAATIPYLRRYAGLMSGRSKLLLASYSFVAAIIMYVTVDYWHKAAVSWGYDSLATGVMLSYAVVPLICLFFFVAITLLYHYDHYGTGLLRYYWQYFLIPIGLIATADFLGMFYYVWNDASIPGQYSDAVYLLAYSMAIASGIVIVRSDVKEATMEASIDAAQPRPSDVVFGKAFILEDPTGQRSFEMFTRLARIGNGGTPRKGYVLSRQHPSQIKEKFGLESIPITWISTTVGESVIEPTKANIIASKVMEFLSKSRNGIVLLDGVESIMLNNDFSRSARMLEQINDFVMQYRGLLVVPIDPKAFDARERAILARNFVLIPAANSSFRDMTGTSPDIIKFAA